MIFELKWGSISYLVFVYFTTLILSVILKIFTSQVPCGCVYQIKVIILNSTFNQKLWNPLKEATTIICYLTSSLLDILIPSSVVGTSIAAEALFSSCLASLDPGRWLTFLKTATKKPPVSWWWGSRRMLQQIDTHGNRFFKEDFEWILTYQILSQISDFEWNTLRNNSLIVDLRDPCTPVCNFW